MLLNSEADLNDFDADPMVFPIFGRGIILYGIVGKGINEWNIREAAEFITGECSCQAKLLNPGVDMLISTNWDKQIKRITDPGIANPLTGMGDFSNKEEEVRRRLESATLERLGKVNEDTEVLKTDPEKVVYLDIFSDKKENRNENNLQDSNSKSKYSSGNKNSEKEKNAAKENIDETYKRDKIPDIEKSGTTANDFQENRGFNNTIMIVFTVIILIVILSGVIIYLKTIK